MQQATPPLPVLGASASSTVWQLSPAQTRLAYYRFPTTHGQTIVFTAEGDLWKVAIEGGVATRITTYPGEATRAAVSPDGRVVAFNGGLTGAGAGAQAGAGRSGGDGRGTAASVVGIRRQRRDDYASPATALLRYGGSGPGARWP